MLLSSKRLTAWAALALWVAAVLAAVPLAGRLPDVVQAKSAAELPRGAQSTEVEKLADRFRDGRQAPAVIVYARTGPSGPGSTAGPGITPADRAKAVAPSRRSPRRRSVPRRSRATATRSCWPSPCTTTTT
ncbi:hypothetical protein ABZ914_12390 [Spirillospora sp. NPDC046719]